MEISCSSTNISTIMTRANWSNILLNDRLHQWEAELLSVMSSVLAFVTCWSIVNSLADPQGEMKRTTHAKLVFPSFCNFMLTPTWELSNMSGLCLSSHFRKYDGRLQQYVFNCFIFPLFNSQLNLMQITNLYKQIYTTITYVRVWLY